MLKDFLSADGKVITLPVAIGATVHRCNVGCHKLCDEVENKDDYGFNCGGSSICHTRLLPPAVSTLTFSNIDSVLGGWETAYFPTMVGAIVASDEQVKKNIATLRGQGLNLDNDGKLIF